jgi:hypothetical protein
MWDTLLWTIVILCMVGLMLYLLTSLTTDPSSPSNSDLTSPLPAMHDDLWCDMLDDIHSTKERTNDWILAHLKAMVESLAQGEGFATGAKDADARYVCRVCPTCGMPIVDGIGHLRFCPEQT